MKRAKTRGICHDLGAKDDEVSVPATQLFLHAQVTYFHTAIASERDVLSIVIGAAFKSTGMAYTPAIRPGDLI